MSFLRCFGLFVVCFRLLASNAMFLMAGYGPLTPTAEKLRRLLHYGQIVQSHALHFFHLASPDLLFGFESEVAKRNIIGVAAAFPDLARQGVLTRKFGQEVIRHIAGKRIHGTGGIPGGFNKARAQADRDSMRAGIDQIVDWSKAAVGLVIRLHDTNPDFYRVFAESRANMMGLVDKRGPLEIYHGALRARDADGGAIFDQVDYATYKSVLQEDIKNWSYMKFPHIKSLGAEHGWYRVGPLARVQVCDVMPTPLAEQERRTFLNVGGGKPLHGALMYHWARMIEMLHAAEMARDLLDDPDIVGTDLLADKGPLRGEAVGVIDAPRGTLFHHYRVDENDLTTYCNLIVSTTNNNQAINEAIRAVASRYLSGREVTEGLLNHVEIAIRAYDPSLSCATHALGLMPL